MKHETGDRSFYVADGLEKRLDVSSEARRVGCHAGQAKLDSTFRSYRLDGAFTTSGGLK